MAHLIIRNIPRVDPETIRVLGDLGVATIHEALGRTGLLDPVIRPIYPHARVAGSAVTVLCPAGDNLMIHAALTVVQPGDVLVVTTMERSTDGMFGDVLATSCQALGVAGLIIDAGVRDTAELEAMSFPVWARAISSEGTIKAAAGAVNVDVECAGRKVSAGDVVIADRDGVMIVPRVKAEDAATLGEQRRDKEAAMRARLSKGELTVDVLDLRGTLAGLGVEWVDSLPRE
jgi:4-hydroxy-4-methyl-2-oxoglutarate aldolase